MISLNISVCKKVGTQNYGSNGATCGLSNIELDAALLDDAEALRKTIRHWYFIAQAAVDEELSRLASSSPAPTHNGHAKAREPVIAAGAPARPTRSQERAAAPPPQANDYDDEPADIQADDDEDAPRTGSQLLGWARKQNEDCKNFIITLGKKLKFSGKVIEWNEAQVGQAYSACRQMLRKK